MSKSRLAMAATLIVGATPALAGEPVVLPGIGVEAAVEAAPAPAIGKTGTALEDLPASVQVVTKALTDEQGATGVKGAVTRNVSGISEGGGSSYGFFDRFTARGLDMNFMSDGLGDGPMTNGYNRTLTGVERVEVLKGPGSALFGSGAPGGTINLVRAKPSATAEYGGSQRVASFGTTDTTAYATGPTGAAGVSYRVDGGYHYTEGFRELAGRSFELLPTVEFRPKGGDHTVTAALEYRHLDQVPDSYGIPFQGTHLAAVSRDNIYYSPMANTHQDIRKISLSDEWSPTSYLTVNARATYTDRDLDLIRNTTGTVAANSWSMTRGLRMQKDHWQSATAQVEPTWTFKTGDIGHTLLTGVEVQRHVVDADRRSATLGSILDIRNPVIPEDNGRVNFATHDFDDRITATYTSVYATDQADVTDKLKLRGGLRYDHFDTSLDARLFNRQGEREDGRVSWQAGALYKLLPGLSPFVGVSRSYLANLSSESLANTATGAESNLGGPEAGLQYEAGIKAETPDKTLTGSLSLFQVERENFVQIAGGLPYMASQRTRGVEVDASVEPVAGWRTTANFTVQDARLTDFPSTPADVGLHPVGVPRAMANLWSSVPVPGLEGAKLAAGISYKAGMYQDNENTKKVPGYVVADLVASQSFNGLDLSAGINNLFDRDYFTRNANGGALPGDPRTFFARIGAKF